MHRLVALVLGGCLTLAWADPAFARIGGPERPPVQQPSVRVEPELAPSPDPTLDPEPNERSDGASESPAPIELVQPETPLPRYDDPNIPVAIDPATNSKPPPLRHVPMDGRGRLATGGLLVGGGAVALASMVGLMVDGAPSKYWMPMFAGGFAGSVVGGVLIVFGHRGLRRYRVWAGGQTESIPPQGYGFLAPGSVLLVGGTYLTIGGALGWQDIMQFRKEYALPAPATPFGIGIAAFVAGATLLGIGAARSRQFTKWRRATSGPTASLRLTPSFGPLRGGAQLGLAGRF